MKIKNYKKVILVLQVKTNTKKEFMKFLDENIPNVIAFEGCKKLEVFFNEEINEMIISETWTNKDAHQKYIDFISNNGVMEELISFLDEKPSIKYFDILEI